MEIVFFLPIKNHSNLPGTFLGGDWSPGPVQFLDDSGTPSRNFFARISKEMPDGLQSYLIRKNQTFWDQPFLVSGIEVTAIEMLERDASEEIAFLLVHASSNTALDTEGLNDFLRLNTKKAKEFWEHLFSDFDSIQHGDLAFALTLDSNLDASPATSESSFVEFGSALLWTGSDSNAERMLRGRLATSFLISIDQYFQVKRLAESWPNVGASFSEWNKFAKKLSVISQRIFWPRVSFNQVAQKLYLVSREWLGVTQMMDEFKDVVDRKIELQQSDSARVLNRVGLVIAISAVVSGWFAQSYIGPFTGIAVSLLLAGIVLLAHGWRNR